MDLTDFAADVGSEGPVTITGAATRGGPVEGVRCVSAPAGIDWVQPDEMTVSCGAGTPVDDLDAALAEFGQCVALPPSGTVGGALALGQSGLRRLGYGPVRDTLLQTHYVGAHGKIVKAGGPTVKNVSGFDLCRLLVGSRGTLGFLGDVILRTRPIPPYSEWFITQADPFALFPKLYRPTSVLWNGERTWVLLEGHPDDVAAQAAKYGLASTDGPPALPAGGRWSLRPAELASLTGSGRFVAEIGVGVVHHEHPRPATKLNDDVWQLNQRVKARFDPSGRLNPGVRLMPAP